MKLRLAALALLASSTVALAADQTIVDIAVGSADHSTLVAAVQAAGLVETLSGAGPFTVFAPTNAAFEKLPAGTVEGLLTPESKDQLTKTYVLRRILNPMGPQDAIEFLLDKLRQSKNNADFFQSMNT